MKLLKNLGVRTKLLMVTVPLAVALIIAVIICAFVINKTEKRISGVYFDTMYTVNSNLLNADRDFYQALEGASEHHQMMRGFGEYKETKLPDKLDDFNENAQQVLDRLEAAASVARQNEDLYRQYTSEAGKTFEECEAQFNRDYKVWIAQFDVEKDGSDGSWAKFVEYFGSARGALNDMQEITEKWAVEKHDQLSKQNMNTVIMLSIIFAVLIAVLGTGVVGVIRVLRMGIQGVTKDLDELASGNLALTFLDEQELGSDEIGRIQKSAKSLSERLSDIMKQTKDMSDELARSGREMADSASQAALASDQVTDAIAEISKGAVTQAESVESAAGDTDDIGRNIETITEDVQNMDQYAADMKNACDKAMEALDKLIRQSGEVTTSVKDIGDTINSTNDSAKSISEFTQAITDIATQTNLLSLNASIEAARAGDAGRGFAVVADEIRALADQSSQSADKIKSIVDRLLADSASSVSVLEKLNESFGVQEKQLNSTKDNMELMSSNVANVKDTAAHITGRVNALNDSKNGLMEVISDLSAISEENAASTEETNASMEELNATFTVISESADNLQNLAKDLNDTISYFKL